MLFSTLTVFPHIVSAETILFWIQPYVLWPLVTVHTGAETIQGRKLFKGGNYMRKYGILNSVILILKFRPSNKFQFVFSITQFNYRISSYSFRTCMYCYQRSQYIRLNSKKNSFRGNYMRKYGTSTYLRSSAVCKILGDHFGKRADCYNKL